MFVQSAFIVPHPPLILPEIGRGQEKKISSTVSAYGKVADEIAALRPETIILISPHSIMYQDYIHISPGSGASGDFRKFGEHSVTVSVKYDEEMVSAITESAAEKGIAAGPMGERDKALDHGTLVPLYFINKRYSDYKLVRISISGLSFPEHYAFGKCVAETAASLGRRTVVIASGDLSHRLSDDGPYSYAEEGPAFDLEAVEAMKSADFLRLLRMDEDFCEAAGECGLRSFLIMAGILDGAAVETEFLSYEGPFGVGYAVCGFHPIGPAEDRHFDLLLEDEKRKRLAEIQSGEDLFVKLARLSLESYIKERKAPERLPELPDGLTQKRAGVFVSLKKDGRLRGCIGTTAPTTKSIADEILQNAVSAGAGDPRFDPVREDELSKLVYSVDVLSDAEPVASVKELDPDRYGVIVAKGRKRGLLLPSLEGVKTVDQQIGIALKKAGIGPDEDYAIQRFEVVRHK
jgi:MEMO1 family protein